MNGHVISLKYFSKGNLLLIWPIVQKGDTWCNLGGRSCCTNLNCVQKGNGLEVFTPIASNKYWQELNKNLEGMIRAIKAQLPRQATKTMTSKDINLTLALEMGEPPTNRLKGPWVILMNLDPKVSEKLP